MLKLKTLAAACGIALTASALPVIAEEAEPVHSLTGNLGLVSDYRFRGFSQTDRDPAVQGGADYTYNPASIYVGTWFSTIDRDGFAGSPFEWDVYGGWRPSFGDLTLDVGALYYMYPKAEDDYYGPKIDADSQDTLEFKLGGTYDFGVAAASLTGYYSDDWFFTDESAWRIEAGVSVPLPADLALSAKFGHNEFDVPFASGTDDYQDWSIGLTYSLGNATLGLTYTDTSGLDEHEDCAAPFQCDATVVGSVLLSF